MGGGGGVKELWKSGITTKIIHGDNCNTLGWVRKLVKLHDIQLKYMKQYVGTNLTICAPFHVFLKIVEVIHCKTIFQQQVSFPNYRSNILCRNLGERWDKYSKNSWIESSFHHTEWIWQHTSMHHYLRTWGYCCIY